MDSIRGVDAVESSSLKSLLNFRDVGRTINRLQSQVQVSSWLAIKLTVQETYIYFSILHEGRLYRSARACSK